MAAVCVEIEHYSRLLFILFELHVFFWPAHGSWQGEGRQNVPIMSAYCAGIMISHSPDSFTVKQQAGHTTRKEPFQLCGVEDNSFQ